MIERQVLLVTLPGKAFYCEVERVAGEPRWIFTSAERERGDRTRYVGPRWLRELDSDEIHALVADWWETKQALGQE